MLKNEEIQVDTYRLSDGRMVYQATHLPTGAVVREAEHATGPIVQRLEKLYDKLAQEVLAAKR